MNNKEINVELQETKTEREEKTETLAKSVVYCGPTVKGVVRQYTVYNNGIPEVLEDFLGEHPAAKRMLIPVEQFAAMRDKLEKQGTAESLIFTQIKKELYKEG